MEMSAPAPVASSGGDSAAARTAALKETFIQLGSTNFLNPTEDQSGFMPCGAENFNLRVGPNYKKHGKKAPSNSSLYEAITMDYFSTDTVYRELGHIVDFPEPKHKSTRPGIPTTLLFNMAVPTIKPAMMNPPTEGPCVHVVWCFQLKAETVEWMQDWENAPPQLKLLEDFMAKAPNDIKFRSRWKMMGKVENWDEMSLPGMLKGYNAKPVLLTASGSLHHDKKRDYAEECGNVFMWNYIARRGLDSMQSKIHGMKLDFCCVIEARDDTEMPERCLFSTSLRKFAPFAEQRRLTPEAFAWLVKQADAAGRT